MQLVSVAASKYLFVVSIDLYSNVIIKLITNSYNLNIKNIKI
jgi:hypothetical protein